MKAHPFSALLHDEVSSIECIYMYMYMYMCLQYTVPVHVWLLTSLSLTSILQKLSYTLYMCTCTCFYHTQCTHKCSLSLQTFMYMYTCIQLCMHSCLCTSELCWRVVHISLIWLHNNSVINKTVRRGEEAN